MSGLVQLAGLGLVVVGCWLLAPWVGVLVLGVLLVIVGVLLEQREREHAG